MSQSPFTSSYRQQPQYSPVRPQGHLERTGREGDCGWIYVPANGAPPYRLDLGRSEDLAIFNALGGTF